ncbi:MAG: hypothetical protein WC654_00195 [Patescibacteria group bacterium]
MDKDRFTGTASFIRIEDPERADKGSYQTRPLEIRRIQDRFNLVTIEGAGQGKVMFQIDGSFSGTWAVGDVIYDVHGKAEGDRTRWEGRFTITTIDGKNFISGTFQAEKPTASQR